MVREEFNRSLLDPESSRYRIDRCELDRAHYVPGECCVLIYEVEIVDRTTGSSINTRFTGRVMASEEACRGYLHERLAPLAPQLAGREETEALATPAAVIKPLRMAACVFPMDGELPTLIAATDRRRMAGILNECLPRAVRGAAPTGSCRVELVAYGSPGRATLRYLLNGALETAAPSVERTIYGKLTADGSGALAGEITSALFETAKRSGYRFHVPEVFGWIPALQLSLLSAMPGKQGILRALKARQRLRPESPAGLSLEEMIEACARIAVAVHNSGVGLGPRRSFEDELLSLGRSIGDVRRISPELGLRLERWLDQLSTCADRPALGYGFCHGDFTMAQVLFHGSESGLVDFDSACQGEPALDIGQFLAYVRVAGVDPASAQARALADRLSEVFLRAYLDASGSRIDAGRLAGRVAAYRVVSLLRRAVHSWQKFKPARVQAALAALDEETSRLPRGG